MKRERIERLSWDGVALDSETHLIQPGLIAPPIVCGSRCGRGSMTLAGELLTVTEYCDAFESVLDNPQLTLIGANISFDLIVLLVHYAKHGVDVFAQVFAMFDPDRTAVLGKVDGRVWDVEVVEALHAIARGHLGIDPRTGKQMRGRYSLAACADLNLGRTDAKQNDRWRLSYALLEGIPIEQWPADARQYPIDDARNTLEVALAQRGHDNTHEISRQVYATFSLALGAAHGWAVDQAAVDALEAKYNAEHEHLRAPFVAAGIIRENGTENQRVIKALVARAYGSTEPCPACAGTGKVPSSTTNGKTKINCEACDGSALLLAPFVPRTEKDGIAKGRDTLSESGDELLLAYADLKEGQKIPSVYIPYLRCTDKAGVPHPDVPLLLRPNLQPLETGRRSYDGATMLLPRSGGVRDCIVARPGRVISSTDYKAGELVTHAQSCIWIVGGSKLAEALNGGLDAHTALAGTVLGIPYEEIKALIKAGDKRAKNGRQTSKPPNFGFPGRMGAAKLVQQQRRQNDVHTPHPTGPAWLDGKGGKVRGYKGLRFCLLMGRAERCGIVKVTEWKGRPYPPMCKVCIECAEDLKKAWLLQWPENGPYFAHVKKVDESGAPIVQHMSKRLRGFKHGQVDENGEPINSGNAIANGYFQALLADAALNAYCQATRECYDKTCRVVSYTDHTSVFEGGPSPLYGSRIPQFQHDELMGEHPEGEAHEGATRISEIMCETLRIACPDLDKAIEAEPCLMRRMYKGAQTTYVNGRLVPWEPEHA